MTQTDQVLDYLAGCASFINVHIGNTILHITWQFGGHNVRGVDRLQLV